MFDILNQTYYGNTLLQWILAMLIILASAIVSKIVIWLVGKSVKTIGKKLGLNLEHIMDLLRKPMGVVIILIGVRFAVRSLNLPEGVSKGAENMIMFAVALICAWAISNCIEYLHKTFLVPFVKKTETDIDDALLGLLNTGMKAIVWGIGIIVGLNNAGYDVGAVLAGLGIGGLALAMASQDSVANVFGGLTIFIQKPFTIGNRIKVRGIDGWVVEIGLRCTTISDFYGKHHIVPNKMFIDSPIENYERRAAYWMNEQYRLHNDSTPEQVREMISILKQAAKDTKHVSPSSYANFSKIGDYFIEVDYWFTVDKWSPDEKAEFPDEYSKVSIVPSELRLNILEAVRKSNVMLALPIELESTQSDNKSNLFK